MPLILKKGGDFAKKRGARLGGRGKIGAIQVMRGDHVSLTKALLGPTNTGKTHRAVEWMLEQTSGMIGLPLRLLYARGEKETWFIGPDTMRARVEQLLPAAQIQLHPRF